VALIRPGEVSSLIPRLGTPSECSTSVLVVTTRLLPAISIAGDSKEETVSNKLESNRWSQE